MARIGFIGVGNMGGPMLRNLIGAGHEVTAFDVVEGTRTDDPIWISIKQVNS